jgi:hypothetical protein
MILILHVLFLLPGCAFQMALSGRGQLILLKRAGRVQHRQELRAGQGSCRRYETVAWSRRGGGGGGKQIDHQEHRQQQPFSASSSWQQQPAALFALGGKEHSSNDPPLQLASNSGMRIATAAPMILAKRNLWNCSRGQVRSFVSGVCDSKRSDPAVSSAVCVCQNRCLACPFCLGLVFLELG